MQIGLETSTSMLERFGVFAREACDRCGKVLGPVRFTRAGEDGAWCSRDCRDGADAPEPGTCQVCRASLAGVRRGTRFCSATCRKRGHRESRTGQNSRDRTRKTKDLQTRFGQQAISALCAPQIASSAQIASARF
jgi:hypothetical protein